MKIYFNELDLKMEFIYGMTNLLVIEDCRQYREFIQNIIKSIDEDDDKNILSDEDIILNKSKTIDVVTTVFGFDYNNKKIQKAVSDELYKIAMNEEHYGKSMELLNEIEKYLYELEWRLDYDLNISCPDFHNIIKTGVNGLIIPDSIIEKMLGYIRITAVLLKTKIIMLIDVQKYFSYEEWKIIEEKAAAEEIILFCIENREVFETQNKIIIDNDGCRVV